MSDWYPDTPESRRMLAEEQEKLAAAEWAPMCRALLEKREDDCHYVHAPGVFDLRQPHGHRGEVATYRFDGERCTPTTYATHDPTADVAT